MKFRTSDGYTLTRVATPVGGYMELYHWTDGDLTFRADPEDNWPIDEDGNRLEGDYIA